MEEYLLPTTELPFLDWPLGQCNDVIKVLEDQWNKLRKESGDDLKFYSKDISEIVPVPSQSERLTLKVATRETFEGFDVVIVSSGFGDEHPYLNLTTPSYWEHDGLEGLRDEPGAILRFVVSGFGDGGQIDALRLAYDFDYGKLSFRFAEALAVECTVAESIRQIESHREQPAWNAHAFRYEQLAEDIFVKPELRALKDVIDDKVQPSPGLVILTDSLLDHPYLSGAAPTHKLMIAYAKHKGVLSYHKTKIEPTDDPDKFNVAGAIYSRSDTHFVVRHGAQPFSGGLITTDEWEALEHAQRGSIEYNFKPAWTPDPFAVPDGWPCRDAQASKYIESLQDLAQRAFANMGSRGKVVPKEDRFEVYDHNLAFKPARLFGKPVRYLPMNQMSTANAL